MPEPLITLELQLAALAEAVENYTTNQKPPDDEKKVADDKVYLGANAALYAWRDVTEAEAEEIRAEVERRAEVEADAET